MKWKSKPFKVEVNKYDTYAIYSGMKTEVESVFPTSGLYQFVADPRGTWYITKSPFTNTIFVGKRMQFIAKICDNWASLFNMPKPGMVRAKLVRIK